MRATDIIKDLLDLLDKIENEQEQPAQDDPNRLKQVVDLLPPKYSNQPEERYADVDSVTVNAGGGFNGPKHPSDIRVKDPTPYLTLFDPDSQPHTQNIKSHLMFLKSLED